MLKQKLSMPKRLMEAYQQQGYCVLSNSMPKDFLKKLLVEYDALNEKAERIVKTVKKEQLNYHDYYHDNESELIVVKEAGKENSVCRFEYITENSFWIKNTLIPYLKELSELLLGHKVALFKDKCNLKLSDGGAFAPHQDIPAYRTFEPSYHITFAIFLDKATKENGWLEFATNFSDFCESDIEQMMTVFGDKPVFPSYEGDRNNGAILEEYSKRMNWSAVPAEAGDIVIFNSFVPHRSEKNNSNSKRRVFFFTFNLSHEGEHYFSYYQAKRADYSNPKFHVATPTYYKSDDNE